MKAAEFRENLYYYIEHTFYPRMEKKYSKENPDRLAEMRAKVEQALKTVPEK